MRYYLNKNVYEAGLERIQYIFSEFDDVIVWVSGGKDSTAIFNMTLKVAHELNRIPLKTAFIDLESEWQATIDIIKKWMYRPDVTPLWFQFPCKSGNHTSILDDTLYCWNPKDEKNWMREKDPISIKKNKYGVEYFGEFFETILDVDYHDIKMASIAGMRAEESPARFTGLTSSLSYKDITWGTKYQNKNHVAFYPLYDWGVTDVWKYIHDNKLEYNKIYNLQFQHGISLNDMRVSSMHHLKSLRHIFYMQEAEPETFNKLSKRLSGISTAKHLGAEDFYVTELPFMFNSWKEYRDYLIEKLIDPKYQDKLKKMIHKQDLEFGDAKYVEGIKDYDTIVKKQVNAILCNDYYGVKLDDIHRTFSSKLTRKIRKEKENVIRKVENTN